MAEASVLVPLPDEMGRLMKLTQWQAAEIERLRERVFELEADPQGGDLIPLAQPRAGDLRRTAERCITAWTVVRGGVWDPNGLMDEHMAALRKALRPNAAGNRLARQGQSELTGLLGPGSEARKTMDDKTLLLKAARAAGYGINQRGQSLREAELPNEPSLWLTHATWWNPLTDSGQALDLAVTLEMDIGQMLTEGHVTVTGVAFDGEALAHDVPWGTDPTAATRRAIVLVAADMAN